MTRLPSASDRTQAALAGAKTRATPFADAEKWEMAYKVLLSGVGSAQRANRASQAGTVLAGLWATSGVKPAVLGGAAAAAVAAWSKSKSDSGSKPKRRSNVNSKAAYDSTSESRSRFRRRPRPTSVAAGAVTTVPEPSVTTS